MDIYRSTRLIYVPIEKDPKYDEFFYNLMNEPGALNFDTALPTGITRAGAGAVTSAVGSSRLLAMYICLPGAGAASSNSSSQSNSSNIRNSGFGPSLISLNLNSSTSTSPSPSTPTPISTPPVPIGIISLSKPDARQAHHGVSSLSLIISRNYQRKGYGREATEWVLGWGFDFARLHRVEAAVYSWNEGALRLYTSTSGLGFKTEGVKREAVWFMGAWRDVHNLAVLEHEWRALNPVRAQSSKIIR